MIYEYITYTHVKTYTKNSSPGPSLQAARLASIALAFSLIRVMLSFIIVTKDLHAF